MASFAALFGMGFTACSNNDDLPAGGEVSKVNGPQMIGFNTSLDNTVITRGLAANVADITQDGFQVWAFDNREHNKYYMGAEATGIICSWDASKTLYNPATTYYWPSGADKFDLSFIALTPYSGGGITSIAVTNSDEGSATDVYDQPKATLNVTIPTTLADQKDIMLAAANAKDADDETDINKDGKKNDMDALQLTFKHALSQIVFKGKLEYNSTITKAVVHSIDLVNIANKGSIAVTSADDVASFTSTPDGSADLVTNSANIITSGQVNSVDLASGFAVEYKSEAGTDFDDITGCGDTDALAHNASTTRKQQLMVLPQTLNAGLADQTSTLTAITGDDAYLKVNIDLFANGDETNYILKATDVYIKLNETTWAPGTRYVYVLEFTDDLLNPIQFTTAITPWNDSVINSVKF